ncbi:rod shape-determining protein RodA [Paucihalobacter ruber]|uniref:rod shape-determining protein RodA n=1 Tax=Paucihalobacter ruber TaxID=2567861 RepID=UPI0037432CAB
MQADHKRHFKFDWITILLFLILLFFGWINIISASTTGEITSYLDLNQPYGKQLLYIFLTFGLIAVILAIEAKFYERFASIIYLVSLLSLVGLFIFGKEVNGALSWYGIGSITIQPAEFAKFATALAIAKYISDLETDLKTIKDQIKSVLIITIPALLILLQNDTGSMLVYASFFFVFYREGIQQVYLIIGIVLILIAVLSIKFGVLITVGTFAAIILAIYFLLRKKKIQIIQLISVFLLISVMSVAVKYVYQTVLKPHQKDRIELWLRLEKDPEKLREMRQTILYNLNESEKAISSGGIKGKGFMEGTRTTGKFVPEQHTDYIFSTVGEEWGFLGSAFVVIVFVLLIVRILFLAESQKTQFSRVYGYGVASILFFHFTINIGMVMGLIPTIGIPLPLFSYGGSGLWAFTIMIFIFIKLDANKVNEW